jgi:hypothetical protein
MNEKNKNPTTDDPLTEIRKFRDEHAKKFNYDVDAIIADLRRREKELGIKTVTLPAKQIPKKTGS